MVRPLQRGSESKVDEFLDAINATVVAIDRSTARLAAELRMRHRALRLPDSLSLAAAIAAQADLLTLDQRLARVAEQEAA
jgi:predicted nucleic acid-binding protein